MAETLRAGIRVDVDSTNLHGTLYAMSCNDLFSNIWSPQFGQLYPRQKPEFGKLDNYENERIERKKRAIGYCDLKFLNIEVLTKDTTRKPVFC